jgi:ubiquinone/menaquinone biosynthesis C-methylase UbiE
MSSYVDRHAELYDLFYADKPYRQEAEFVSSCLTENGARSGGRVLELACGTGRHAFELEQLGWQMVATDYSADMLRAAERAKQARRSEVELAKQDMRTLDVPARPIDGDTWHVVVVARRRA